MIELKENDLAGNPPQHRDTVQTLFKIVANLIAKPLDPTVRRLNKTNKAIQSKILAFPSAVNFLRMVSLLVFDIFKVGFDTDKNQEAVEFTEYKKETLTDALLSLELHIKN